jgi:3-isopropylmalate/(R)-2-methylmalate dehydratase small subunit
VYAVRDYGIRAVVAAGFSDIFRMNCCWNGVLPVVLPESAIREIWDQLEAAPGSQVTIDLAAQTVTAPKGNRYTFEIDESVKQRLMSGLDDIGVTEQFRDKVDAFERAYVADMPWIAQPEA